VKTTMVCPGTMASRQRSRLPKAAQEVRRGIRLTLPNDEACACSR
jgi:hypothetical protein